MRCILIHVDSLCTTTIVCAGITHSPRVKEENREKERKKNKTDSGRKVNGKYESNTHVYTLASFVRSAASASAVITAEISLSRAVRTFLLATRYPYTDCPFRMILCLLTRFGHLLCSCFFFFASFVYSFYLTLASFCFLNSNCMHMNVCLHLSARISSLTHSLDIISISFGLMFSSMDICFSFRIINLI